MSAELTAVEGIKARSRHLRGSLPGSLANATTGALAEDDTQLSKFHGIYQQDNRDIRSERKRQRLEPAYSFMIRARVPGGLCTTRQWLNMDSIATQHANGTIRLTTRQAFQLHGVIKSQLKQSIAAINQEMMDTLAACGDVNRNVMAPTLCKLSSVHREVQAHAVALSAHLTPATRAYHEIWLEGEKLESSDAEPIYGDTYLPRKFKTAFVIPPQNDVDVFTQDLGFMAVIENGRLIGYNVCIGGGMGMSHGEPNTYPQIGQLLGFCRTKDVLAIAEAIVTIQRDFGDRSDRKHARLKYTLDDRGMSWFRDRVTERSACTLGPAQPYVFSGNGDFYGWQQDDCGSWHYLLFVQNGRIADVGDRRLMSGLRAIALRHQGEFVLTPNQNLAISNISESARIDIEKLLLEYGIENTIRASPLRLRSMACVAFPTCGLAMAESERYLPSLIDAIDRVLANTGLGSEAMTIRMTGCPNGCARPYVAEIGLVGKGPGRYNLYLGAGYSGDRLGCLYRENLDEAEILAALTPLFERYATERRDAERFGDFLIRANVVREVGSGVEFHSTIGTRKIAG